MSLSTKSKEMIIGHWISQYLFNYLEDHKLKNAEKVLVKIEGINEEYFPAILTAFFENESKFKNYYFPVIRTIKEVDGFESYVLGKKENGVWLRNNVKSREALILLMNERTPEAQSLKDIVPIDEAQLLSVEGLKSLDESLNMNAYLEPHHTKELMKLIEVYQNKNELDLQLSMLIKFIESVVEETTISSDQPFRKIIGVCLPHLRLFRDDFLNFDSVEVLKKQLKNNFLLSHLRKNIVSYLNQDKLKNSVDIFIANEIKSDFPSEIWKVFDNQIHFLKKSNEFIERKNYDFLSLVSYSDAERIFGFKVTNSLKDKLNSVRDLVTQKYVDAINFAESIEEEGKLYTQKLDAENRFDKGIEAINAKNDLDSIRSFREEFEEFLEKENITKKIINIENKLENPSKYQDLFEAILSESLVMLEELEHEDFNGNLSFEIYTEENFKLSESQAHFFRFHLQSLSMLSSNIRVSVNFDNWFEVSKEGNILPLTLRLLKNEKVLKDSEMKIELNEQVHNNSFLMFINQIQNGYLQSIEIVKGSPNEKDFREYLKEQERNTLLSDKRLIKPIEQFNKFNEDYTGILKNILEEGRGVRIEDLNRVTFLVEEFLKCSESDVDGVRKILSLVNEMGTINIFETKNNRQMDVMRKIISVFNPIRFIAYAYKLVHFGNLISDLSETSTGRNKILDVEDLKQYKEHLIGSFSNPAPSYIVSQEGQQLFLRDEFYGQGIYLEDGEIESVASQSTSFAKEIEKVAQDYIRVYPYTADCLDILFLYVTNLEFVKKSVEQILKKDNIRKLNVTIHSPARAAMLYDEINQWIQSREEYMNSVDVFGEFPRLEINVLPFSDSKTLEEKLDSLMLDFDLAVFVDYFGQQDNLKIPHSFISETYRQCEINDRHWVFYENREFKSVKEGTRLINYVSPTQPKLMQQFYNMQAILQEGVGIEANKIALLKGKLSVTRTETNTLYKLAHEKFNWVITYDKFMDPLLMKQVAEGSNIIRYHVNRSGKEEIKVLVSSSDSIRRSPDREVETNYYRTRLHSRLKDQLKVSTLDKDKVDEALKIVKDLSGGLVLRALGPGKFVNEFLSVYLTVVQNPSQQDTVVLWDMCDELEWFRTRQKRPDLLRTEIQYSPEDETYNINFTLIELKLVQYESHASEIVDAKVQLLSGEKALQKFFRRFQSSLEKKLYLNSFLLHLEDKRAYEEIELAILHNLMQNPDVNINFNFTKTVYAYVHNKNIDFDGRMELTPGHYFEKEDEDGISVHTFTRSYILSKMNVSDDEVKLEISDGDKVVEPKSMDKDKREMLQKGSAIRDEDNPPSITPVQPPVDLGGEDELDNVVEPVGPKDILVDKHKHPEEIALLNVQVPNEESFDTALQELGNRYANTLQTKLRINGVQFSVERTIVGASVIRIIGRIPPNQSITAVEKKAKDMPLWLHIDSPPTIFSDRNGINIDINRNDPDTIYFSQFMKYVRNNVTNQVLEKGFIVPIGLSPLNEVMTVDFNDTEPHMLVAGSTGSGKSVSLNSIVMSMMCLYDPTELQFVFIDPKQVEFSMFDGVKHTKKVLLDVTESADYLDVLMTEMEHRYSKFRETITKNIMEYNELLAHENRDEEIMPRMVIVFDEFADFMMQDKEFAQRIETAIKRLGQMGRAAGLHMIVCTQSPKAEIISTTIKNNLAARLCLRVTDSVASNVVMDTSGGENLAGKGDYLFKTNKEPARGKSPYLQPLALRALMQYFKK